jgi:hypothetical protein
LKKKFMTKTVLGSMAILLSIGLSVSASENVFKTKGGVDYNIVNLAVGTEQVPQANMPDQMPGILIDGRTYVPLRAVVDAVNGDVAWDGATKTASVMTADNVINFQDGYVIGGVPVNNSEPFLSLADLSTPIVKSNTSYENQWTLEFEGKVIDISEVFAVYSGDSGFYSEVEWSYNFPKAGVYKIKLHIREAGTIKWYAVAQKEIVAK